MDGWSFRSSHDGAARQSNMNSSDICLEPLGEWGEFSSRYNAPGGSGVYAVRMSEARPVGRLRGTSDLIYIGQGDLQARLKANSRSDFEDTGWIFHLIVKEGLQLEVRCYRSNNTKCDEEQLLLRYLREHLELPPANRAIPKRILRRRFWHSCLLTRRKERM
jgi:hypothetical protein